MDPTAELILQLLVSGAKLYTDYKAASEAGDQAALDQIHARIVAASDAMAPAGAVVVAVG